MARPLCILCLVGSLLAAGCGDSGGGGAGAAGSAGSAGTAGSAGAAGAAGMPGVDTLAGALPQPKSLEVTDAGIFWIDELQASIKRLPLEGGTPMTVAAGQKDPRNLWADASSLYWLNKADGTIQKVALGDGATPAPLAQGLVAPSSLVATADELFWLSGSMPPAVMRVAKAGGAVTMVAAVGAGAKKIAVDEAFVYIVSPKDAMTPGNIARVARTGGMPAILVSDFPAGEVKAAADGLYYADGMQVFKVDRAGGTPTAVVTTTAKVSNFLIDGGTTYLTLGAQVVRLASPTATPEIVATNQGSPAALTVHDTHLYWLQEKTGAGAVMRAAR